MTEPRCTGARITQEGLATSWSDVPTGEEREGLLLSIAVERSDGSEVQFGGQWDRQAAESPVVFAWDTRAVQRRDHEAAETAITRSGDEVRILFPRSWVDALVDAEDLHALAIATVDGVDGQPVELDLVVED